jgi:GntR family transcriptional regulator
MNRIIFIDKNKRVPIYEQIKDQIMGLIQTGQIKTGDQLPTIRELSVELSVNVNTVALAYRDLTNQRAIVTERGRGSFVAGDADEGKIRILRTKKLQALIDSLISETDRLGFSREEVGQALVEQNKWGNTKHAWEAG